MKRVQNGAPTQADSGIPAARSSALVDAEQDALLVDESEEARRRAHDGSAEVALALERARLARDVGEVAHDEDELVVARCDGAALVLAHLAADVEGVLDVLERVLRDRAASGGEHGVGDVLRQPLVDGPPEDVVGRGQEIGLAVDLEPAVDAVGPDPEDRVRDRGDQRPRLQVARGWLVEPRIDGRRAHSTLVARSSVETRLSPGRTCPQNGPVGRGRGRSHRRERVSRARS